MKTRSLTVAKRHAAEVKWAKLKEENAKKQEIDEKKRECLAKAREVKKNCKIVAKGKSTVLVPKVNDKTTQTEKYKKGRNIATQTTIKVKVMATQTTETPIVTKDVSTQTVPSSNDISIQCDLGNLTALSLKFQLMQQQNHQLQQEKSKLLSQKNSIAAATPRKPYNELSSRQARRREKQGMKVLQERSPSLLSPISLRKLTPSEDLKITLEVGISWKQRERLKSALDKRLVNCFCGTRAILKIKSEETKAAIFKRSGASIYLSNIKEVLIRRVERLFMKGTLTMSNHEINCAIAGDKGGDNWANVTKFGFFISTTRANSYLFWNKSNKLIV
ncbi:unnamed protein product [Meloidogyne enterolobii]|uniref:Uncharacterized protein n=1 Tax=Meloidogyne enterolobii TaxID=390850 RepID=A0ACB0Y3Q3_MELEN